MNTQGLDQLVAKLAELAANGAERINRGTEVAVQSVLEEQYSTGTNPDGVSWAAKVDGSASKLQDTGAMRASSKAVRGVRGVTVNIPKPGGFHQSGTKKMPARELVPDGPELPRRWEEAVSGVARSVVLGSLGK